MEFDCSWKTISSISCHVIASGFFVILVPISYCIEVTCTLSSSDNVTNFFSISSFLVLRQKLKGPRKKPCNTPWYIHINSQPVFLWLSFSKCSCDHFWVLSSGSNDAFRHLFPGCPVHPQLSFLAALHNEHWYLYSCLLSSWLANGAWLFSNNFCNYPWRSKLLSIMYSPSVIMITVPLFIIFPRWL